MTKYCPRCGLVLTIIDETHRSIPWVGCACEVCGWAGKPLDTLSEPMLSAVKMPYVSIDLETTGLDEDTCQILEIGAVYDDWTKPLTELPIYHRYVVHPFYRGQPYALALNSKILKRLSGDLDQFCLPPEGIAEDFAIWLDKCGWRGGPDGDSRLTPAGKNFASFDKPFLKKLPGFTKVVKLAHRVLDPAIYYWRPLDDDKLPDTKTCLERAGLTGEVAHTAVEDALAVVKLIRYGVHLQLRISCTAS